MGFGALRERDRFIGTEVMSIHEATANLFI
jgi:hypothetical protein